MLVEVARKVEDMLKKLIMAINPIKLIVVTSIWRILIVTNLVILNNISIHILIAEEA